MLANAVLREPWGPCSSALELGCGLGLPGIAALARGWHVTFSDRDLTALRFAGSNAKLNGYQDFKLLRLDWQRPPDGLAFSLVLASDLVYEVGHVEPLVATIKKMLAPNGKCLLTDQDRPAAASLRQGLVANDLVFTAEGMRAGEPGGRRFKGSLYRIRHRTPA
jgi:predicted nicotinamide N-methyase